MPVVASAKTWVARRTLRRRAKSADGRRADDMGLGGSAGSDGGLGSDSGAEGGTGGSARSDDGGRGSGGSGGTAGLDLGFDDPDFGTVGVDGGTETGHDMDGPPNWDGDTAQEDGGGQTAEYEVGSDGSDGQTGLANSDGGVDLGSDLPRDSADAKRDGASDSADGSADSAAKDGAASEPGRIDGSVDQSSDGPCRGCLCRDPSWSCSNDTWVDPAGHAVALAAEGGFFEFVGGNYVSEGVARVSPGHRIWYSFQPATAAPESKPLAVFFNGGPGSATSAFLFSLNTGPFTLDPAKTGTAQIAANPSASNWAQFANLLYIDAPGTGFSYPIALDNGDQPSVGIDLDHDAALMIRVIVRFLDRHPALSGNPVVLVGESYGRTRSTLMLDHLLNYQSLTATTALYQNPALHDDLVQHFAAVFPQDNPQTLSAAKVASQFGHQVLIQPVVAGDNQWDLNSPNSAVCPVSSYEIYQCDEPDGWYLQTSQLVASRLTTLATLKQALGIDPTTIAWLYTSARTRAYGRSGTTVSAGTPEMNATFGTLGVGDNYFLILNTNVLSSYDSNARNWHDRKIGISFINDVVYVSTFITNAKFDMMVYTPAIAPALRDYTDLVATSVYDSASRTGFDRAGWIEIGYAQGVIPSPTTREIRFPFYASAGHSVSTREPDHLLADVMQWYASTLPASPATAAQPVAAAASSLGPIESHLTRAPTATSSEPVLFLGP
jgi:hypothetical protein